jgi:hypothetical protein
LLNLELLAGSRLTKSFASFYSATKHGGSPIPSKGGVGEGRGRYRAAGAIPPKVFKRFTGCLKEMVGQDIIQKIHLQNVDKILLESKNENYTVFEF